MDSKETKQKTNHKTHYTIFDPLLGASIISLDGQNSVGLMQTCNWMINVILQYLSNFKTQMSPLAVPAPVMLPTSLTLCPLLYFSLDYSTVCHHFISFWNTLKVAWNQLNGWVKIHLIVQIKPIACLFFWVLNPTTSDSCCPWKKVKIIFIWLHIVIWCHQAQVTEDTFKTGRSNFVIWLKKM